MPKMRSIAEAFKALKQDDPETGMTLSGLRRLISIRAIPSVRIGRRILVNYDEVLEYLSHPKAESSEAIQSQYGQIRKVI